MTSKPRHRSVRGGLRATRQQLIGGLDLPPSLFPPVDAHSRLRGPYTAGGMIARRLAEVTLGPYPHLARRHDIEIRALAPELREALPIAREALAESVPPGERTRVYPRLRTRRLAHGLTDFLRDYLVELGAGPRALVIENMHHADPTDRELVATFVRRLDASLLTVVACAADPRPAERGPAAFGSAGAGIAGPWPADGGRHETEPLGGPVNGSSKHGEQPWPRRRAAVASWPGGQRVGEDSLADALATHATWIRVPEPHGNPAREVGGVPVRDTDMAVLAAQYVNGDGISDEPALLGAYARLSKQDRARLHDARADELERAGAPSAQLGAIPYHRERGADPHGAGVRALREATVHCFAAGFHDGVVHLASRGAALADLGRDPENWWLFTSLAAGSLAALGRGAESEALYGKARSLSTDPAVHRTAAYETAMLYARHHTAGRRDPWQAKQWINDAVAFAGALADAAERAFHLAFTSNGVALIEMRLGNTDRALELVDESLSLMDRELPPGSHPLDRCSLLANRARLLAMSGRSGDALACQDMLVALDPTYGEYHFERGNLLHALGRDDEALAAYARAENLSLPLPELHYNRAELLTGRGDADAALADLDRALELAPDLLDAYVNRAGLLAGRGDNAAAWADVNAGLAMDPGNPYLLCVRGQLEAARGRTGAALESFNAAIAAAPSLTAAWANRAALWLKSGEPDAAVADLNRALDQGEDAVLLFNRAVAYRVAGRPDAALRDAERALALSPDDEDTRTLLSEINADA
jgi:tetratricopeptide (TPR) repeat protein